MHFLFISLCAVLGFLTTHKAMTLSLHDPSYIPGPSMVSGHGRCSMKTRWINKENSRDKLKKTQQKVVFLFFVLSSTSS